MYACITEREVVVSDEEEPLAHEVTESSAEQSNLIAEDVCFSIFLNLDEAEKYDLG